MNKAFIEVCLLAVLFCFCSYNQKRPIIWKLGMEEAMDTIPYQQVFEEIVQNVLLVKYDVDLMNRKCCLPKDITLRFEGGVVKNGTLVGDGTRIESRGVCFDKVRILGSWDVPEISTRMFKDLDYDNSLKDVMALTNPKINNRVVIEDGDYQVSAAKSGDVCILVCSNTKLIIEGLIRIVPNVFKSYDIVQINGKNVEIKGNGTIIGDKHTHIGKTGEWGMGVDIRHAHNVWISGLTIKNCWGDCIYIGGRSGDVLIENCLLDHGRRQGVSITSADRVTIKNCTITNVGGAKPEYAVDVEPNKGDIVDHITIKDVKNQNCKGGFKVYCRAKYARVGTVVLRGCSLSANKKKTIVADMCDTLVVENCDITQHNTWNCITCRDVGNVVIRNNTLHYDKGIMARLKDWARPKFGKKRVEVIEVKDCGTADIAGNHEQPL